MKSIKWLLALALVAGLAFTWWRGVTAWSPRVFFYNLQHRAYDEKIRFWGRVVDADGAPLEGVRVTAHVFTFRMIPVGDKGYREFEIIKAVTKRDGSFLLEGAFGFTVAIVDIHKDGYVLPPHQQEAARYRSTAVCEYYYKPIGGGGRPFLPDPSKPEIFKLWKLANPEPLITHFRGGSDIKLGGDPLELGWGGDKTINRVKVKFPPDVKISVSQIGAPDSGRWEVKIAGFDEDDGVVKANPNDPFMFTAPKEGYQESITYQYDRDTPLGMSGQTGLRLAFFVRSKKNHWHGSVNGTLSVPSGNNVYIDIHGWMNPNGSLNLQYDATNRIEAVLQSPESYGVRNMQPPEESYNPDRIKTRDAFPGTNGR